MAKSNVAPVAEAAEEKKFDMDLETGQRGNAPASTAVARATTETNLVDVGGYDSSDIGGGFEDFTIADLTIPFLAILQSGSPQVKEDKGTYLPGAKAGMFFNTVSNELIEGKKGVQVIPVHRKHHFIEWIPRDQGGGMVGDYSPNDPRIVKLRKGVPFGKISIEDGSIFASPDDTENENAVDHTGNDLVETFTVFALIVKENGTYEPMALSFASTAIKHYRKWMTTARGIQIPTGDPKQPVVTPPMFSHLYRARTQFTEKNNYDWYAWMIGFENGIAEKSRLEKENPLFKAAKEFRSQVMAGQVELDRSGAVQDEDVGEEGENDKKF